MGLAVRGFASSGPGVGENLTNSQVALAVVMAEMSARQMASSGLGACRSLVCVCVLNYFRHLLCIMCVRQEFISTAVSAVGVVNH